MVEWSADYWDVNLADWWDVLRAEKMVE